MVSEAKERNPAIAYIYTAVKHKPEVVGALADIEESLRGAVGLRADRPPGVVVERAVFRRLSTRITTLDGDTAPVALAKAVARETQIDLPPEIILYQTPPDPKKELSTVVFTMPSEKEVEDKPPRVETLVRDGDLYISIRAMQEEGVPIKVRRFKSLLEGVDSIPAIARNGVEIRLYQAVTARSIAEKWITSGEKPAPLSRSRSETVPGLDPAIWIDYYQLSYIYDITRETLIKELRGIKNTTHGHKKFFLRQDAGEVLTNYLSKQRNVEGIYFREGEPRITIRYLNKRFGLHYATIRKLLSSLPADKDAASGFVLYPLVESLALLKKREEIPRVNSRGIYIDDKGIEWAHPKVICRMLDISDGKLQSYLEGIDTLPVRTKMNQLNPAYPVRDIEKKAADYIRQPKQNLCTVDDLAEEFNVPAHVVRNILKPIRARVRGAGRIFQYPEEKAFDLMRSFIALPEIDPTTGQVVSTSGEIFALQIKARSVLKINQRQWRRAMSEGDVAFMKARMGSRFLNVYKLSDLAEYGDISKK